MKRMESSKPARPTDPGKTKGDGMKAAMADRTKKPSKIEKASKKKER